MRYDNCFNANRRTLNYYCVNKSQYTFPFVLLKWIANLASLFRQRTLHYISCRTSYEGSREETYSFYLVDLLPVSIPTYTQNLKIICQERVCKIDIPPSLSIKTLKNMTPEKMETEIFLFEILATNID